MTDIIILCLFVDWCITVPSKASISISIYRIQWYILSSLELVSTNNNVTKQMGILQMNICTLVVWEQTSCPILHIYQPAQPI